MALHVHNGTFFVQIGTLTPLFHVESSRIIHNKQRSLEYLGKLHVHVVSSLCPISTQVGIGSPPGKFVIRHKKETLAYQLQGGVMYVRDSK